jgi:hypothetical protein
LSIEKYSRAYPYTPERKWTIFGEAAHHHIPLKQVDVYGWGSIKLSEKFRDFDQLFTKQNGM